MKSRNLLVALVALLVQGCDLHTVPEDVLTPENFYQTVADAEAAVFTIYEPFVHQRVFRRWFYTGILGAADEAFIVTGNADVASFGTMTWTSETIFPLGAWEGFYRAINRANLAIDRISEADFDQSRSAELIGEAKFLRGLAYFYLVRLYGDVPLITSSTQDASEIARTPNDQVYRQIIEDATAAAQSLPRPVTSGAKHPGRATRGSALALLADAHLTLQEWQESAAASKQLIDLQAYSLYPDYLQAFLPAYENGPEHVFSFQANGPASGFGLSTLHVVLFYPRAIPRGQGGGVSQVLPTEWHYESYIPGDYRHDVTFSTRWTDVNGKVYKTSPHVFKFRPSQVEVFNSGDVDVQIYRYADVLLMYAEALNELGRTQEAVRYLNMVRARARNADGEPRSQPADYTGPMGKDAVRDAIFQERRWELAYEGKRWFDLVRRGEAYFMAQLSAHDPQARVGLEPTDILWPIPQSEMDLNPALTQNPGY